MIHSLLGWLHTIAAIAALALGALILSRKKGTRSHKIIGYSYSGCVAAMVLSAFGIYRLTGSFNVLHLFAVVSTVALMGSLFPVITNGREMNGSHFTTGSPAGLMLGC